ncbi:MAG: PEP-CTERM sorting domain-containing protein [Okeania sp. SIO2D1]|nr:PEP-CTERM sorting domain-containing protein [Okeania sp. SIO2D1]
MSQSYFFHFFQKFAPVGVAALGVIAAPGISEASQIYGFQSAYDPNNWTLVNDNANGFVDTSNAPDSITLTGSDDGSGFFGTTIFSIPVEADGTVSFNYNYDSFNVDGPFFDPFGISLNGTFTQITDDFGSDNQVGSFALNVMEGDIFGFEVQTVDNIFGPSAVTISNFKAPAAVPEPGTILGLLAVSGLGLCLKGQSKEPELRFTS